MVRRPISRGFTVTADQLIVSPPVLLGNGHVDKEQTTRDELTLALEFLQKALAVLDQGGVPAQIGAHVDLAIHQLHGIIGTDRRDG